MKGLARELCVHGTQARTSDIYYFSDKKSECDFVVHPHSGAPLCIQACHQLTTDNEAREIAGLEAALSFFGLTEGYIITADTQDEIIHKGKKIHVRKGFEPIVLCSSRRNTQ